MPKKVILLIMLAGAAGPARANTELDRMYSLDTVGALRSLDNVDGLFGDYTLAAYKEYFSQQSRFIFQDLSHADAILTHTKIPYAKVIDDPKILNQIARSTRTQTIVRTKIRKEGPDYRVTIDWLHAPQMDLLASETFTLQEGAELANVKSSLQHGVARVVAKVPFLGQVTGRDARSVTVNIGATAGLKHGDELEIGTLDEVKRHPLLHAVVDWRITHTGRLVVDQVDEGIAFCKLTEEDATHPIMRYQKITQVIQSQPGANDKTSLVDLHAAAPDLLNEPPKLGWVAAGLALGTFSRDYTPGGNTPKTGSSGLFGGSLEGDIWLTGDAFAELALGYAAGSYSQQDTTGKNPSSGSASVSNFRLDGGYNFLGAGSFTKTRAFVRFGYKSDSASLPVSQTNSTAPLSIKSFFIGVGGDLPIRDEFGVQLNLDFGVLNSATQTGLDPTAVQGASNIGVFVGVYYHYKPRISFRLGASINAASVDFEQNTSAAQKTVEFIPAVLYYF